METQTKNPKRKSVKAIPDGFHSVTPLLMVDEAEKLIKFIEQAFNGKQTSAFKTSDKKIMHATVRIGDSEIMISDAMDRTPSGTSRLYLYVEDVDKMYNQALEAKGTSLRSPTDEFYGDRSAGIRDTWGNEWWIATHQEDVSSEEMERRKRQFEKSATA
jgi:uncharacterized glyoxalase superfamily protein PhnB